jgi:hypothetical protein
VVLAAGSLVGGGSALAAPLDFTPGQTLEASCSDPIGTVTLAPLPGKGAFTPYLMSTGQTLVPTEFRLTSGGAGLKTRHLVPQGDELVVTRAGSPAASVIKCEVAGTIEGEPFTAVIVGGVVGVRR